MSAKNVVIENAKIGFRNFSGKEGKFNPEGRRNFCVFLDRDIARSMEEDGWSVKWLKPRNEEEQHQAYIQIAVGFKVLPPKIVLITKRGKTVINEDSVNILDWVEIENVDLSIRPRKWDMGGKSGIKAYLKSIFITLVEDELEEKYFDVPDSAVNSMNDAVDEEE